MDSGFVKTCDEFINSLYLEPVSISNDSQGRNEKSQMEFTMLDYAAIRDIFETGPELFKLLVSSLCPSIYGHELVKAGLLLALFGGTSKYTNDSAFVPVRGDPHVLVVGDPGLGKSQMLQSCHDVAPKSVFVTATGATTSGLTVTISKGEINFNHYVLGTWKSFESKVWITNSGILVSNKSINDPPYFDFFQNKTFGMICHLFAL